MKTLISLIAAIAMAPALFAQSGNESNSNDEPISLESIIGFEVESATMAEMQDVRYVNSRFNYEGGVKIKHLTARSIITIYGYSQKHLNNENVMSMHSQVLTGNIIFNFQEKLFSRESNRTIRNVKDFCTALIEYKRRGRDKIIVWGAYYPENRSKGMRAKDYEIDMTQLDLAALENYLQQVDDDGKPIEKQQPISQERTPSEQREETREIYASNVDFDNPGKYYGIIIGVNNYADPNIPDLDSLPIKDAMQLKGILTELYQFENENIVELYNPTRRDLVMAFSNMSKKISNSDNLLIYYGGHGHYEKENDIGYWLPADAEVGNPANWYYNDQLVADLKKIKSLHTLLLSDACFSGSIFKTRAANMSEAGSFIRKKYELPSRKAITSGTLKTVPNVSVFMKYLLDRLKNNKENFFSASQLFQSIEQPVSNNSSSLPQFGVIQNVGDEGGDFIFIKR